MTQVFDTIIIGFGKGGKTLAGSMASKGLKVALIEKSPNMYGGTCINKACIPTKKLEDLSRQVKALNLTSWESKQAFYQKAIADKETLITALRQANYQKLNAFDTLTIITGEASFIDENQVAVTLLDGETMTLQADKIFINTGTKPFIPAIDGIKTAAHVYSSDELLNLEKLPKSLTIIGAGFIGLEFASIYSAFGTHVTVIHPGETILPQEDSDDRESIIAHFNKKGVQFINQAQLQAFQQDNQATVLVYEQDMMIKELTSEAFLVATGRRPDVKALNLENGKIEVNERGFINVSETLQTSNSSVWALGDVTGGPQFTYISLDDYRIVLDQLFGEKKRTTKNRPVYPTVLFLDPAYARVGLNVREAKEKGFSVQVAKMPVAAIPRAKQIGKTEGFLKIVIDSNTSKILGASLLAHASSELIHLIQMAIDLGLPYTYLRDQIYAHPTMAEAFNELLAPSMIKSV